MVPDTTHLVFNVESGRLVICDPCYDSETRGYHEVDAVDGQWLAEVRYSDEGAWGIRVASLFAVHSDHNADYAHCETSYIDDLGVDSGQMCIWDADDYTTDDWRYDLIGYGDDTDRPANGTLKEDMCYRDDLGVASKTGYGDGCYTGVCFHLEDDDSPIIAVEINFL